MEEDLDSLYDSTCEATTTRWTNHPQVGGVVARPFHPTRLSLTTGNFLNPSAPVLDILSQIHNSVGDDPLADVLDPACLHFTFLALSQPNYTSRDRLPDLTGVEKVFTRHCRGQRFTLHHLRLVALPNALLLAGSPDASTASRRATFAEALLSSSWAETLRARYPQSTIPPAFWHSTLVRYQADYLPPQMRRLFAANYLNRYGEVSLEIDLLATSYNWKIASRLDGYPVPPNER